MSTILAALAAAVIQTTAGLLVSPAELTAALKDPAVIVVAVGNNADEYNSDHIPGARFVRYDQIAIDIDGIQWELPPVEQLRAVLPAAGISDRSRVVVYGSVDWSRRKLPAVMGK